MNNPGKILQPINQAITWPQPKKIIWVIPRWGMPIDPSLSSTLGWVVWVDLKRGKSAGCRNSFFSFLWSKYEEKWGDKYFTADLKIFRMKLMGISLIFMCFMLHRMKFNASKIDESILNGIYIYIYKSGISPWVSSDFNPKWVRKKNKKK